MSSNTTTLASRGFSNRENPRKGVVLMSFSILFFVANALLIRVLGTRYGVGAWTTVIFRFAVGVILVTAVFGRKGRFQPTHLVTRPLLVLRGILGGCGVYLYYFTIHKLGAGRATFIYNTYFLWGTLFAALLIKEPMSRRLICGMIMGLAGLLLVTDALGSPRQFGIYDLIAIIGAVTSGLIIVIIRHLHRSEHSSTIFGGQCFYGLAIAIVPALLSWKTPTGAGLALLIATGLLSGLGQLTMTFAYRELPVARGSQLQLLVPIGIALGGVFILGERFSGYEAVGALLVLASSLLAAGSRIRHSQRPSNQIPVSERPGP